jgi:hypothetical protein
MPNANAAHRGARPLDLTPPHYPAQTNGRDSARSSCYTTTIIDAGLRYPG